MGHALPKVFCRQVGMGIFLILLQLDIGAISMSSVLLKALFQLLHRAVCRPVPSPVRVVRGSYIEDSMCLDVNR